MDWDFLFGLPMKEDVIFGLGVPGVLFWGILILAIIMFFAVLKRKLSKATVQLQTASERLEQYKAGTISFEQLSQEFNQLDYLSPAWSALEKTLDLKKDELDEKVAQVTLTQPVELYFNETKILGHKLNLKFYQAFPNMLVGIGLLFTFVGLIAALYFASKGVNQNHEQAVIALQELLHAATFKFSTSLAGLLASLSFSVGEKWQFHKFDEKTNALIARMESAFAVTSLEKLAIENNRVQEAHVQELLEEAKQQTGQLKTFSTDLATSVGKAVSDAVREEFRASLSDVTGDQFNKLSQTMDSITSRLEALIGDMTQKLTASGSALEGNLKAAGESIGVSAGVLEKSLVEFKGDLVDFAETVRGFAEHTEQATDALAKNVTDLSNLHTALTQTLTSLQGAGSDIAQNTGLFADIVTAHQESVAQGEQLREAIRAALDDVSESRSQAQRTAQTFADVEPKLSKVFEALTAGLEKYTERVSEFHSGVDKHLANALQSLKSGVDELGEKVEDLQNAIDRLPETFGNTGQANNV